MSGLADGGGLIAGLLAGGLHFALLRRNAELYLRPRGLGRGIALQALRLVLLAGVLVVLARQGALPLLLGALGVLVARRLVLRRATGVAP
ncbi:MAG TPA: ATP synthase subunit I [Acetobacteraceae bacterium]|nr:ATP synthase subunit I [Acetobacteraceae bacterium]